MAGDGRGEEVGAVDVDSPETSDAVDGVLDGRKILHDAGRRHEAVDLAVCGQYLVDARGDTSFVRDVGLVRSYPRDSELRPVSEGFGGEYRVKGPARNTVGQNEGEARKTGDAPLRLGTIS